MGTTVEQRVPPLEAGDHLTRAEFLRRWEAHPEIKKAELIGGIVFMPPPPSVQLREGVPPLCPGDKLTRAEFLRRWEAHPEIKKAELIGGIVFMPSPVSREHGVTDSDVGGWLFAYRIATPGTESGHNTTSFILEETPQPDNFLRILPEYGGSSREEGKYLGGRPELLAEISASSASYDLHEKLDLYQAARISEYLAVLLYEKEVRWHVLVGRRYRLLSPDPDGVFRSRVFQGLWLDSKGLLAGNMQQVLARLQEGLNSPEHQRFVAKLARRKRTGKK
jgi:Uma2 family endonuclease